MGSSLHQNTLQYFCCGFHSMMQGSVLMNIEFLKTCQFTVCLYENETLHKVDPEPDEYRQWRTQGVGVGDLVISVINISQCAAQLLSPHSGDTCHLVSDCLRDNCTTLSPCNTKHRSGELET